MASGTYFVRSCPTCGRKLEVRVELLGREVECVHCRATFVANQDDNGSVSESKIDQVLARAKRYIDSIEAVNSAVAK